MAIALLSLLGVLVSAYLYLYKLGKIGSLACGAGGCEAVQASRWSSFVGVDVALLGLVGYLGMLGLALAGLQPGVARRRGVAMALLAASGVGVLFAGYLTYLELFVIHAICFWCSPPWTCTAPRAAPTPPPTATRSPDELESQATQREGPDGSLPWGGRCGIR